MSRYRLDASPSCSRPAFPWAGWPSLDEVSSSGAFLASDDSSLLHGRRVRGRWRHHLRPARRRRARSGRRWVVKPRYFPEMRDVVIVEAARTAVGKRNGTLANTHPTDVLGPVQMAVLRARRGRTGAGRPGRRRLHRQGRRPGDERHPHRVAVARRRRCDVPCSTVDSQCGSSQHAVNLAVQPHRVGRRGRRHGLRRREHEHGADRRRRGRRRQGRLRQADHPRVLRRTTSSPASSRAPSASPTSTASPATTPTRFGLESQVRAAPGDRRGPVRDPDRRRRGRRWSTRTASAPSETRHRQPRRDPPRDVPREAGRS